MSNSMSDGTSEQRTIIQLRVYGFLELQKLFPSNPRCDTITEQARNNSEASIRAMDTLKAAETRIAPVARKLAPSE